MKKPEYSPIHRRWILGHVWRRKVAIELVRTVTIVLLFLVIVSVPILPIEKEITFDCEWDAQLAARIKCYGSPGESRFIRDGDVIDIQSHSYKYGIEEIMQCQVIKVSSIEKYWQGIAYTPIYCQVDSIQAHAGAERFYGHIFIGRISVLAYLYVHIGNFIDPHTDERVDLSQ